MSHPLADLAVLDQFKLGAKFPPGYPADRLVFYSPVDDVHGALLYCMNNAQNSIDVAMFGFDDDELAKLLLKKLEDPKMDVRLTLDKSQAGGVHESKLLDLMQYPSNSIAIGSSEHGRIMHMKMMIIDKTVIIKGSTNWSDAAEHLQDNELTIEINPAVAAEASIRIGQIHIHMLNSKSGGSLNHHV